jgi:hypothetical protein
MTGVTNPKLQALRLKYNAAVTAQRGCVRALAEANRARTAPSAELVENEERARRQLEQARVQLLAAMTEAITGQKAGDPIAIEPIQPGAGNRPPGATS